MVGSVSRLPIWNHVYITSRPVDKPMTSSVGMQQVTLAGCCMLGGTNVCLTTGRLMINARFLQPTSQPNQ